MIDIISLLSTDGYIMCNKTLIKLYGGDCAILIGELCSEYNYYNALGQLTEDSSFYSTQENIEDNTGLNAYSQRKALKTLQEANIITVTKKGLPAKNYYKINTDKLCEIFTASPSKFEGLEVENLNINNNKQKTINNKVVSKDTTDAEFTFGISDKPKKKNKYQQCIDLINDFTDLPEIRNALIKFLDYRFEIKDKPFYVNQFKGMLNALDKAVEDSYKNDNTVTYVDVIEYAITRGWLSFYPIPINNRQTNPDTNKSKQIKSDGTDLATNEDGSLVQF